MLPVKHWESAQKEVILDIVTEQLTPTEIDELLRKSGFKAESEKGFVGVDNSGDEIEIDSVVAEVETTFPGGAAGYVKDGRGFYIWNNKPMENESATWSGESKDGYASGHGRLTWCKGEQFDVYYEGTMVKGKFEGETQSLDARGNARVRIWRNGRKIK